MGKSTTKEKAMERYHSKVEQIKDYLGNKCNKCGSTENLEIDHVEWKAKSFDISGRTNLSWEKLKTEVDKCQLLCVPCHLEKTAADTREQITGFRDVQHGTYVSYRRYKCRCSDCVKANSEYLRAQKLKVFPDMKQRKPRVCGTLAMYQAGCKCADCRKANTQYVTAYNKRKKETQN